MSESAQVLDPAEVGTRRTAVGSERPRTDGEAGVLGATKFAADRFFERMLHGRLVMSPYAHARIISIDATAALAVPGVSAVLRAEDLALTPSGSRANEPLAREEVVFAGQPVALVVAETEAAADDAVGLVVVEYQELEPVLDAIEAMAPGAPLARLESGSDESDTEMHGTVAAGASLDAEELSANVTDRFRFASNDAEVAFARCAVTATGTFRSSWVHQGYLEPQVAVAWPEGEGGLVVQTSTQGAFYVRSLLADVLGLPLDHIRVEGTPVGGGFGGKIGLLEPLVGAAALALRRAIRITLSRMQDMAASNPAPGIQYELTIGAERDGTFAALEARVVVDTGAFVDMAPTALAGPRVGGPYRWGAWDVRAYGVRTNRPGSGAYRAPTAPQATFALEQLVDELAGALGMDPVELRLKNVAERGDARLDGTPWPSLGLREVLETARRHPVWQRRSELPTGEAVGFAAGLFPGGRMGATATCRLDADGGFTVVTGYADLTGAFTAIGQIAAETIGVSADAVRVSVAPTDTAPPSGVSGGSMVTYCLGSAVALAAADAREQILRVAALELETDEDELMIDGGSVHPSGKPDRGLTLEQLGTKLSGFASPYAPIEGHGSSLPPELAPSAAAAIVHVRVDQETGEVSLLDYAAVQDVGRAINPALCRGQMHGGAAQAIGLALYEELEYDEDGTPLNASLLSYTLPRAEHIPPIDCVIVEVPAPHGPHGAKGIGESAFVPGAAAIANALAAATGIRLRQLPMTPMRIWEALRSSKATAA